MKIQTFKRTSSIVAEDSNGSLRDDGTRWNEPEKWVQDLAAEYATDIINKLREQGVIQNEYGSSDSSQYVDNQYGPYTPFEEVKEVTLDTPEAEEKFDVFSKNLNI